MRNFKFKLWVTVAALGLVGVASLLLSPSLTASLPPEAVAEIPPAMLPLLLLINPAILVLVATAIGVLLYDKVNLSVPLFEKWLGKPGSGAFSLQSIVTYGLALGAAAGTAIVLVAALFTPYLPAALVAGNGAELHIITKLLYGGVTEEILLRFGLMTFLVWVLFKLTKQLTPAMYWAAIVLASVVFAAGHLPVVFQLVGEPTLTTYAYIILANSIGGLLFGYAYYRKGLECAFIAHAFAHVTMVSLNAVLG